MRPRRDLDLGDEPTPMGRRSTIATGADQGPADADRRVLGLLRLGRTAADVGKMLRLTVDEVRAAAERAQRAP